MCSLNTLITLDIIREHKEKTAVAGSKINYITSTLRKGHLNGRQRTANPQP